MKKDEYNAKCWKCGKLGNFYNTIEPDYKCECGNSGHEDEFRIEEPKPAVIMAKEEIIERMANPKEPSDYGLSIIVESLEEADEVFKKIEESKPNSASLDI